jgi:hypothetical protein
MSSLRNSRHARALSYFLLVALVLPLTPLAVPAAVAQQAPPRSLLLFGVTDDSSSGRPELRKAATDALQMALDNVKGIECTEFSRTSPLVRRAEQEGRLLPTEVESGPSNAREAIKIGYALDVDMVVVASIQSYRSPENPRSVEIILSGQLYDVKPNYDVEAGDPVEKPTVAQAFGVVGASRKLPGYKGSDKPLAREAIEDAAYRVAKAVGGATISDVTAPRPAAHKKSKLTSILGALVAVGLVAWAVSSSGGDSDTGPSPSAVPPTALPLQVEGTDTIRVRWVAPTGTALTILKYQLQRSVNRGAYQYFGDSSSSADISSTTTEYPDFNVTAGNSYAYRIRVVYTNQKFSSWVYFTAVGL